MRRKETRFQTLVERGRREPIPPIDVVGQVAARIAPRPGAATVDWPLWGVAGLSALAAAAVLVVSFQQGVLFGDPLAEWLRPLVMVIR